MHFIHIKISIQYKLNKVECQGEKCCYASELTDIISLKIKGDNGLSLSVLTNVQNIQIEGKNESPFSLYCNKNVICKIDCLSKNACTQMLTFCDGLCYVRCNTAAGM